MSKEIINVTVTELANILANTEATTPITLIADTEVKMNKFLRGDRMQKNSYYGKVRKLQESNVFVNVDYTKAVNKRLTKEGKEADFVAQERTWGERVGNSPIISRRLKSGIVKYYLEASFVTNNKPKVEYTLVEDGVETPIDKSILEGYLPAQSTSNSQGLDNELAIRTFGLENIKEIRMNKKIYVVQ